MSEYAPSVFESVPGCDAGEVKVCGECASEVVERQVGVSHVVACLPPVAPHGGHAYRVVAVSVGEHPRACAVKCDK